MQYMLTAGNSTMPRSVGIWNLPAPHTCTPSLWCSKYCYACKNRYQWKSVQRAYWLRWSLSLREDFETEMSAEIQRRHSLEWIRVHISGDFYDLEYVHKWANIARNNPGIIFRTNTKRQDLLPEMVAVFPKNFVVRESIDISRKPTGLIPTAAIVGTRENDDSFVCCNDCKKCDFYCWTHPEINVRTEKIL